jgi:uncharacterized protein YdeI (YjbR/CyaY-like superfamily)
MPKTTKTLYLKDRKAWRKWLEKNHAKEKDVWLIYYKKHTGKPRIPYDHAVEEALCFGWIDSTVKRVDDEKYIQRYSPRNKGSVWAISNIRRVKKMMKQGKMTKAGIKTLEGIDLETHEKTMRKKVSTPRLLSDALKKNKKAEQNFKKLRKSHKEMFSYWINDAKKQETKERRVKRVVQLMKDGKKSFV